MSIKVTSTLNSSRDVNDFIEVLRDVLDNLEVLGQIQAAVGGMSMASRAGRTFNNHARLENFLQQIEYNISEGAGGGERGR